MLGFLIFLAAFGSDADRSNNARLLNPGELVTADDYPLVSLRKEEQGTVTVRVRIDETGTAGSCDVVKSSGHTALDEQTCSLIRARARFEPKRACRSDLLHTTDRLEITGHGRCARAAPSLDHHDDNRFDCFGPDCRLQAR